MAGTQGIVGCISRSATPIHPLTLLLSPSRGEGEGARSAGTAAVLAVPPGPWRSPRRRPGWPSRSGGLPTGHRCMVVALSLPGDDLEAVGHMKGEPREPRPEG